MLRARRSEKDARLSCSPGVYRPVSLGGSLEPRCFVWIPQSPCHSSSRSFGDKIGIMGCDSPFLPRLSFTRDFVLGVLQPSRVILHSRRYVLERGMDTMNL